MPRATTKAEVAERFEQELAEKLPDLADRIYWTMGNRPPGHAIADTEAITFCFTGGQYDYPNQVGQPTLDYRGTIRVSVWQKNMTDEAGTNRELLIGPRGLYRIQAKLLQMQESYLEDANSTDSRKDGLLLEGIKVLSDDESSESDPEDYDAFTGILSVDFSVDFQWDLTLE